MLPKQKSLGRVAFPFFKFQVSQVRPGKTQKLQVGRVLDFFGLLQTLLRGPFALYTKSLLRSHAVGDFYENHLRFGLVLGRLTILKKTKIEGTPILKLAMVKRL